MPQAKPYCATVTVGVAMKCYNAAELFALYNDPARLQPRDLYAFTATLPVLDEVTLVRARSTRSQMGMGLFTTRPFACNQPITYYSYATLPSLPRSKKRAINTVAARGRRDPK